MSSRDIVERAKAALEGVTEGPWIAEFSGEQGNCVLPHDAQSTREAVAVTRLYHQQADAEFIAAARTLVPELIAEVERNRDVIAEFRRRDESADRVIWRQKNDIRHLREELAEANGELAAARDEIEQDNAELKRLREQLRVECDAAINAEAAVRDYERGL